MTDQQQNEDEPLLMEITPEIASDLLVIYEHISHSETELTVEAVVALAVSYFRSRLEQGTEVFIGEEAEKVFNAKRQSQQGP